MKFRLPDLERYHSCFNSIEAKFEFLVALIAYVFDDVIAMHFEFKA